jgi:formamidopyrimidine-DNA glycosylase
MPELPEVETVTNGIKPHLEGQVIADLKILSPKLRYIIPKNIRKDSINSKIILVKRKAKYIQIFLDNGNLIIIHLGMTGRLLVKAKSPKEKDLKLDSIFKSQIKNLNKHDHMIIQLKNGSSLIFNDVRKFGMVDLIDQNHAAGYKFFKELGLEPLEKEFSLKAFEDIVCKRNKSIKSTIMDSSIIVGIGNIYANEALFNSGIHPERITNTLTDEEIKKLRLNMIKVLKDAIKAGGSTLKDFANEKGQSGYFQFNFKVYARTGEPCLKCKTPIERIKQNGRSSFVCHQCQV